MKKARVKIVKLSQIEVGERGRKEYTNIQELGLSMKMHGVIQPLAVAETKVKDKYILIAGGRRFKAAEFVQIKEVPVRIYEKDLTDRQRKVIELEENLQREDLTYVEKCALTEEIHETFVAISRDSGKKDHSMRDTAKALGVDVSTISKDIQMSKMIKVAPILGEQKSQAEATKMVSKFSDKLSVKKIAEEIQKTRAKTPLQRQKKQLMDSYIVADFFKGVKSIPDKSVTFADVDPDWGIDFATNREGISDTAEDYHEIDSKNFVGFSEKVADELWRVMKEGSWGVMWHGSEWSMILYDILTHKGFYCEPCPGLWIKDKGGNRNPDIKLSKAYEQFLYFRKGQATLSSTRLGRSTNFEYKQPPQGSRIHPTEKPVEMMEEILETFIGGTKGVVLVPFAGGGNTLLAGSNKGHVVFGFDLEQVYKDGYVLKVESGRPGEYKSYK